MSKKVSSRAHSSTVNAQRARTRAIRRTIAQRLGNPLSLFRQLTHSSNLRDFHSKRILQREATKGVVSNPYLGFFRANLNLETLHNRVCRSRKERRQVLFAQGKTGGNHKPPRYTSLSLVRC